ncbi:MAG: exodeoxyribonuclease VII large subunit [Thermoguttaceae bacterium]|nr:exodeoxyribonuclease VII large subunit [Thermoguttaceae bacterium]
MSETPTFTVTQITTGIQNLLGTVFSQVRVSGEISDLKQSSAGHCYFLLKDETAQISAVLWSRTRPRGIELRDGLEVVCEGKIEVYPPRGNYQFIVSALELKGLGALEQEFLALKQRLTAEGLFDPAHKKPIPRQIHRVGVVTSPDGAAIHDFLQVLKRRWCGVDVCVFPSPVQGTGAAEKLAQGVEFFNRWAGRLGIDCIVLTRGGGSMEDLWEFNQERLVRAIYDSELPVISGVGHEIDVTLCDLAADRRALTPSEAAELISPNVQNLAERLQNAKSRLDFAVGSQMDQREMALNHLAQNPVFRFPTRMIDALAQGLDVTEERLNDRVKNRLEMLETQMGTQAARLEALSPLNVLSRGYTVTQDAETGKVLRSVNDVQPGQKLKTRFPDGECVSRAEN